MTMLTECGGFYPDCVHEPQQQQPADAIAQTSLSLLGELLLLLLLALPASEQNLLLALLSALSEKLDHCPALTKIFIFI